jgi:hypothetical protein
MHTTSKAVHIEEAVDRGIREWIGACKCGRIAVFHDSCNEVMLHLDVAMLPQGLVDALSQRCQVMRQQSFLEQSDKGYVRLVVGDHPGLPDNSHHQGVHGVLPYRVGLAAMRCVGEAVPSAILAPFCSRGDALKSILAKDAEAG